MDRRLANQDFWDNHLSGHSAHLVDAAMGLKQQASAAEDEDDSFYPPDLRKVSVSKVSAESGGCENVSYVNLELKKKKKLLGKRM